MSGQWPPDWEDPDDGHADAGLPEHPDDGRPDLDLSEVTSFLASVGSPSLPASFEARISAAIAAEAAARANTVPVAAEAATRAGTGSAAPEDAVQAGTGPSAAESATTPIAATGAHDAKGTVRSDNGEEFQPVAAGTGPATSADRTPRRGTKPAGRAARASGPGNSRPEGRRRRLRMPSAQAASWALVCCLVLAGFGFLVTRAGGSSSSSEAASGSAAQSASAPAGATVPQPAAGRESEAKPGDAGFASGPSAGVSDGGSTGFLVYSTGTAYHRSTLASQVQGQLASDEFGTLNPAAAASSAAATAAAPTASAPAASSSNAGGTVPSAQLAGCVSRLTGGAAPSLVNRASYDGTPAYIIAVPTRVWVVRLGCTAADTQLITAAPLKG
jgi:hypothetical protein